MVTGTTGLKRFRTTRGGVARGVGAIEFKKVMGSELVPAAEYLFDAADISSWQLLMDQAPAHSANLTKKWLRQREVQVVKYWPSNSPDLNPMENVWAWMKKQVYNKNARTLQQLKDAVHERWMQLPDWYCSKLMCSMERRLRLVVEKNGGYTGY